MIDSDGNSNKATPVMFAHTSVTVPPDDRDGLESLARYLLSARSRPPRNGP